MVIGTHARVDPYTCTCADCGARQIDIVKGIVCSAAIEAEPAPLPPVPKFIDDEREADWRRKVAKVFDNYRLIA